MRAGTEVANRFRLERPLGSGGMGTVWAAEHLVTHKAVALKVLNKHRDDPDARRRVLREARAACAVHHPNVATVHDVVEDEDGNPILVMDLLHGESLADKLARERTIAPAEAIAIIRPVLSALSAAHAIGIVHRDLKPGNVFLVEGDEPRVMILDFGVAKLAGNEPSTKATDRLTETGAMVGTPHYMAPEQAFGEPDIDARADLWAVGAVLYECLAGHPPTDGQNLGQILKVLAKGRIEPLTSRVPSLPAALAALVDQLLAIERSDRPDSARAVLERLDAVDELEGQAAPARIDTPKRARRHTTWASMGALAFVALASLVGLMGVRARMSSPNAIAPLETTPVRIETTAAPPIGDALAIAPSAEAAAPVVRTTPPPSARRGAKSAGAQPTARAVSTSKSSSGPLIDEPTF